MVLGSYRPTGETQGEARWPVDGIDNVRETWSDLSLDRRQAVVSAVLDRVTLAPATGARNRFDPDRVGLTWRA